jgi:hypothetical protein
MDSCQLIRKETKMDVVHLNQGQLAARWHLSEATLERWRSEGLGQTENRDGSGLESGRFRAFRLVTTRSTGDRNPA